MVSALNVVMRTEISDAPGTRPQTVVLATKFLMGAFGFSVLLFLIGFLQLGRWRIMSSRGWWILLCIWAFHAAFIALVWNGVSWARTLFLFVVGCLAAPLIWSFVFSLSTGRVFGFFSGYFSGISWVNFTIDLYVAYLLLQKESKQWFER
jgi:hypothetical protein